MNEPNFPTRGPVAGKYEILHRIGQGGMGSVWEGRHSTLGTRVAIKFVDPEFADSQEARRRFITEAKAAATIRSKFAIQIFDHGVTEDGRPYIVMELLTGEPLARRLEACGRLALADTARIIGQVCRALQRAHDAGIIHRDLKPENVFLVRSPDDEEEIAKVLDFGIAKFRGPPGGLGMSSSTKTGAVIGTPFFMSPEQARGLREIDHRTDLWSLGVIAYKCVTGVLPFDGVSVGDLLVKICTAPAPIPSLTAPELPAAFDTWFAHALEKEPDRRFSTASELGDALALAAGLGARTPIGGSGQLAAVGAQAAHAPSSDPDRASAPAITPLASPRLAEVTSAPFTSPALVTRSPRSIAVAAVGAAILGGSLGVLAVIKLVTASRTPPELPAAPSESAANPSAVLDASAPQAAGARGPDGAGAKPTARTTLSSPPTTNVSSATIPAPPALVRALPPANNVRPTLPSGPRTAVDGPPANIMVPDPKPAESAVVPHSSSAAAGTTASKAVAGPPKTVSADPGY